MPLVSLSCFAGLTNQVSQSVIGFVVWDSFYIKTQTLFRRSQQNLLNYVDSIAVPLFMNPNYSESSKLVWWSGTLMVVLVDVMVLVVNIVLLV